MAEAKSSKKRTLKKTETVRERATKAQEPAKPRRVKQVRGGAAKPLKGFWRLLKKLLKPLRFLLWPFKTRPMRFVGRALSKLLLFKYFRESWAEVRQVTWPNRSQTVQLTLAVFVFAFFFSVLIGLTDFALDKLFKALILN